MTPEVPSETQPWFGRTTPTPTALAALSPAPPVTMTCEGSPPALPHLVAQHARDRTAFDEARHLPGVHAARASSSSDQQRLSTSSQSVPEASDMSLAYAPVRRRRSQSFGNRTRAVCAKSCGSCSRTHMSLGAVKPESRGCRRWHRARARRLRAPRIARSSGRRSTGSPGAALRHGGPEAPRRASARRPDRPHRRHRRGLIGAQAEQRCVAGLPPVGRVLLAPQRLRSPDDKWLGGDRDDALRLIEKHDLELRGPEVDDQVHAATSPRRLRCPARSGGRPAGETRSASCP